jgi:hypothetical protein
MLPEWVPGILLFRLDVQPVPLGPQSCGRRQAWENYRKKSAKKRQK